MHIAILLIFLMGLYSEAFAVQEISIPLRDTTKLAATVYVPEQDQSHDEKYPVIVQFTPYGREEATQRGEYFSAHGYIFVSVDSRGVGGSEGLFTPFVDEGKDGYDVIEYLANHPLSNGKVGTLGGSYRGFAQWAIQKYRPPSLHSMIAIASVYPGYDFPMRNNIFSDYTISWLDFVLSKTDTKHYGSGDGWDNAYVKQKNNGTAFKDLDKQKNHLSEVYQTWLAHPNYDMYWQKMVPNRMDYSAISTPILSITGHYDGDQRGTLKYYKHHQQWGDTTVFADHYLVMGPWDHSGTRKPKSQVHEAQFSAHSLVDMPTLYLDWFNWTLKGERKPNYLHSPVIQYVQKTGRWFGQNSLRSGSKVERISLHNMRVKKPNKHTAQQVKSRYVYNPKIAVRLPLRLDMTGTVDIPQESGSYVAFDTPYLTQSQILIGQIKASIWIEISTVDTDIYLDVFEVCKGDEMRLLSQAYRRVKYRDNLSIPISTPINTPFELRLDDFDWMAREIEKGCKLRFIVRSSKWHHQKHFNSGLPVSYQTMAHATVANISVLHDENYPSYIQIPWLKPSVDITQPVSLPLTQ
ncbi:CocE/NonD family hydrolase [Pseudoalteromonas luteoviolacea]|uniref:Xaa-Pro dipeptidyl-peptidase C-terminal domain-containing protein n=1 Tax=Pseudoalteromonas luteoviolacea S4054 TaxID=1129367 RepID=A0A0F6A971_9GAMM|nr:CocE/NonD family hydrolase [Pseudoalteromonas luteoviolacea]AOT06919.1 hypothetical protein S4054249_03075 [Pseudoalteromonas luteoviolacea]AOT11837.1 hypothetical protein S40542_03075 [Pseudoalteromonas luteoviolacea]AOT16749.1 hypothetical protein S4054_03075 [Pseudoalteromonas luteoviolacea]KKE82752.1 hypothetical protein N479_16995 [Pseudoalteromonas luteoviolacea S4054]KZN72963.1 hypothetical protein N481_14000 [Pseudoalteromonas luteoviolacea S4047-1]